MDLQDTKSNKSLAEIYEDEYAAARDGDNAAKPEVDSELEKRHEEIEALFEDLSSKLDALSNARFTPKPVSDKGALQSASSKRNIWLMLLCGPSVATQIPIAAESHDLYDHQLALRVTRVGTADCHFSFDHARARRSLCARSAQRGPVRIHSGTEACCTSETTQATCGDGGEGRQICARQGYQGR